MRRRGPDQSDQLWRSYPDRQELMRMVAEASRETAVAVKLGRVKARRAWPEAKRRFLSLAGGSLPSYAYERAIELLEAHLTVTLHAWCGYVP